MRIILASASPRRKELLDQIGIDVEVLASQVEEVYSSTKPEDIVKELSLLKALDIAQEQEQECIVIGADTVVVQDNTILGKPEDDAQAFAMLKSLQGRDHMVYTGVAIIECREEFDEEEGEIEFTCEITNHAIGTKVYVMPMSDEEIQAYIETGDSRDKAGAYGIQGAFAAYIEGIEGDYYNVMGLPISYVNAVIRGMVE